MPPKKVSALAQAVKDCVTKKTAAKKPAVKKTSKKNPTAQEPAPKMTAAAKKSPVEEPVAKKSAAKKPAANKVTANKSAAVTADNNPAVAPKRTLKSAGKAPTRRTSGSKKRKASDDEDEEDDEKEDDEKENEAPSAKKAKTNKNTTARTAAKKTTAGKATDSKAAAAEADVISKAMADVISNARGKKRKAAGEDESENREDENETRNDEAPRAKKVRVNKVSNAAEKEAAPKKAAPNKAVPKKAAAPKKAPNPALKVKVGVQINFAPTQPLDIFVFGEGSAGELGLGSRRTDGKMPIDVKRPRFNPNLSGENPGVVQFACGGMHGIALTKDNKVLTWGVNDNSALGRDTTWNGGLRRASPQGNQGENDENENNEEEENINDGDDEGDEDDSGLNPRESTPTEIDMTNVAPGTKFVQVAATDSASFALTEDGRIYSWGTFRAAEGILGFSKDAREQFIPVLLPEPKKVVAIATGSNHVLTLDNKGKVQTWGAYQQSQLGRRIVDRDARASSLRPGGLPFKRGVKIAKVAAGSYHSFAVTTEGRVYAWGLNNFGELGVEDDMGVDGATILQPTLIESLLPHQIVDVVGGEHHSVALTNDGKVFVWGRMDSNQCGFAQDVYDRDNSLFDENDLPRILMVPMHHDTIPGPAAAIAVGTDTSIVVTRDGEAWSWGFNSTYQCGLGETNGEVYPPRIIDNSVIRDRKIIAAGCGGQFSLLACRHEEEEEE